MCGIAGILYFKASSSHSPDSIVKMTNALSHRGPDADGFFVENEISLGHRRLSIIDLSIAANQPFIDHSGRYIMVYNGEMYNYQEVRAKLKDYPFKTSGDTETLIAAYAQWGIKCIEQFKGMFAFAIWDRQEKELCIVRDRMGVKPLYYYVDDEKLLFASEVRSILASGLVDRKISKEGLFEYFSYQSVSYPLTIIEGIKQLEAGSYFTIKNGATTKKNYWSITNKKNNFEYPSKKVVQNNISDLLIKSVQRRLVSDVPVGAFLSGGIDSSVVVGLMATACNVQPATFNISFSEKEYDESAYAEIVAKKFNTNHTKIKLSPTVMLDELENALSAMDTPSGDGINTFVVSKAIRNAGIKVALSGIGGDELFAGYPIFNQFQKLHAKKGMWKNTGLIRKIAAALMPAKQFSNKKYRMQQLLNCSSPEIEEIYPVLRQILSSKLIHELLNIPQINTTALQDKLLSVKSDLHHLPVLSQVSAAEYLGYTQHTLLKDTDQMSMAVALEAREPFFDTDLVEYVLGIPDQFKQPVYSKSLLVESVKPLLPDEIVFRKKQGFVFPWELWMKKELRSFCETRINKMSERAYFKPSMLKLYWQRFLNNDPAIRWADIWLFVVLEYWLEKNGVD
ncbi:MAG: asparagine synthase (glutamine-hydrolyzing) [Chitinophagaceae bacterium]|nr:asparagine synthase (glutamine-hydrolyzing) [Chitinophagaceae bacterium]